VIKKTLQHLALGCLMATTPVLAQDKVPFAPLEELAPLAEATSDPMSIGEFRYFSLVGGGELVGRLLKDTPEALFVDIGPEVIRLPLRSIERNESLEEALERFHSAEVSEEGLVSILGPRDRGGELRSQQEIVEAAKRGVVLIRNARGSGSGFVLDGEGRIVTNHHVVGNQKYQTVTLFRPRDNQWERVQFENVETEAYSPLYDIAILRLNVDEARERGVELVPLPIAPADSLRVGDSVYAIGNPGAWLGRGRLLEHTVSDGIVSSLTRNVNDVLYIQTTAAVNPGNSGGPLINERGEVVGVVTLKAFLQEGIGFALPVGLIQHFISNSEAFSYSEQAQNRGYRYLSPD
jgi:serine protease Do